MAPVKTNAIHPRSMHDKAKQPLVIYIAREKQADCQLHNYFECDIDGAAQEAKSWSILLRYLINGTHRYSLQEP